MILFKRRQKRSFLPAREQIRRYALLALAVLVLFFAVFGMCSRAAERARLARTRDLLAAAIQDDMNQVLSCYDTMSRKSNTAILENVLPAMQQHMYTASILNDVLVESFGEKYSVLSADLYQNFEAVVTEYAKRIAQGQSTADAAQSMSVCMTDLENTLRMRFGEDGLLMPRTALK